MNKINNFSEIKNLKGYLINENGEVFSEKSGKTLKVTNGVVEVYVDGINKKLNVAHLVLLTFVGNPDNAKRVRYKNGDRNDASLENIEWKTPTTTKKRAPQTKATTPRQKEIADLVAELGSASVKEITYFTGVSPSVINTLAKKGIIELFEKEVYRSPHKDIRPTDVKEICLSKEQNEAFETLSGLYASDKGEAALLYGVT